MINNLVNPGHYNQTVIIMGICPLIIPAQNAETGLMMGLLFSLCFLLINICILFLRNLIPIYIRLIFILTISTTIVISVDMLFKTYFYEKSIMLEFYGQLIAVSSLILVFTYDALWKASKPILIKQTLIICIGMFFTFLLIGLLRGILPLILFSQPAGGLFILALLLATIQAAGNNVLKSPV